MSVPPSIDLQPYSLTFQSHLDRIQREIDLLQKECDKILEDRKNLRARCVNPSSMKTTAYGLVVVAGLGSLHLAGIGTPKIVGTGAAILLGLVIRWRNSKPQVPAEEKLTKELKAKRASLKAFLTLPEEKRTRRVVEFEESLQPWVNETLGDQHEERSIVAVKLVFSFGGHRFADPINNLSLKYCEPGTLPTAIGQLTHLTSLELIGVKITQLPAEVGNLSQLRQLEISHTPLSSLPPEIGKLHNLTQLFVFHAALDSLPDITHLTRLSHLELPSNRFTVFPLKSSFITQSNLQTINLWDNQLASLPADLATVSRSTLVISVFENSFSEKFIADYRLLISKVATAKPKILFTQSDRHLTKGIR